MRRFHSYGPVDEQRHFTVPRKALVKECLENLVGDPEKGGHYFTIWAPRQTGKTWLMQQVKQKIEAEWEEQFSVHNFSFGDLRGMHYEPSGRMEIPAPFSDVLETGLPGNPTVKTWKEFTYLFSRDRGLWQKPLILMIDEADTAPAGLLDLIVGRFREMYLHRHRNYLHSLALIGVRAVLGVESDRGSPFNIQRSLHVPIFTPEEVADLFGQYQEESGQPVESNVVGEVYEATLGQPGLVGWFGELLTEKYNPGMEKPIDESVWKLIYHKACHSEWNNTILNLTRKADSRYREQVLRLFSRSDMRFSLDADWCSYLYLNGIIRPETVTDEQGQLREICRFSSPFIQERIYNALTMSLIGEEFPILPLDPLDDLSDVFDKPEPDLPALLERYKPFLLRLEERGIDPWKEQPRRADLHLTQAVGHFHLYAWLREAVKGICVVSPEFPTGNGKVDLHLKCGEKMGVIEVKSFESFIKTQAAKVQAAAYAQILGLKRVTVALFVPVRDPAVLEALTDETDVRGVRVAVRAIGWT